MEITMWFITYNARYTHMQSVCCEFTAKTKIIRNIFKGISYNGCEKYIKCKESGI